MSHDFTAKKVYRNPVQLKVAMAQAWHTYVVVSRGVGKSTGIGPDWFLRRVQLMPGGASFILGASYRQILSRTLPPFISSLEEMGLIRGVDFVVNQRPPDSWRAKPIVAPEQWSDTVAWSNGHTTYLVSQDRPGSPNSLSVQFGMIDEARLTDRERFASDMVPAIRGNSALFGHLPEYMSLLFMTDQPRSAEGRWILDMEKKMDPARIDAVCNLAELIARTQKEIEVTKAPTTRKSLMQSLANLKVMYDDLRRKTVLFVEGNAFENIHALTPDYIRAQQLSLPDLEFRVSILNERMQKSPFSFYPDLDDVIHTYKEKYNYDYLRTVKLADGEVPDCRQDADLDTSLPLIIGPDHGSRYNGFQIGQAAAPRWLRVVNSMYVLHPQTTEDLAEDFCKYYKNYPTKVVHYVYDHTMKAESGRARNLTYVQEAEKVFKKHGWKFIGEYLGHTPSPTDRFTLWSNCLRGNDGFTHISFNREKTETLRMSMHDVKAKTGRQEGSTVKDKKPERDDKLSQEKAPHGSDGADLLLWHVAKRVIRRSSGRASSPLSA
jgi:hypothetical protein